MDYTFTADEDDRSISVKGVGKYDNFFYSAPCWTEYSKEDQAEIMWMSLMDGQEYDWYYA